MQFKEKKNTWTIVYNVRVCEILPQECAFEIPAL